MRPNNFTLVNLDTDSISICKPDMSPFSKQEDEELLIDLNRYFPEEINFAPDGEFEVFVVLKTKNYIMYDGKKIKLKGSGLKSATLEPILKLMLNEMIDAIVFDRLNELVNIYHKYVLLALNISDIKLWSKKMSLSPTTFKSTRTNETKVIDAIKGSEYGSGDRIYVYSTIHGTLKLAERFENDHDIPTYLKKIFNTTKRFETVLDIKSMFKNYSLKGKQKDLQELLDIPKIEINIDNKIK